MKYKIRKAKESDSMSLSLFMNEIMQEKLPHLIPFNTEFNEEIQKRHIRLFNNKENGCILLIFDGDNIVGALDFMPYSDPTKKHAGRLGILIKKSKRRFGLGQLLLNHLFVFLSESELIKIDSEILDNNIGSIEFHKKNNFILEGHKTKVYQINNKFIGLYFYTIFLE